jgi:hypothetical protein
MAPRNSIVTRDAVLRLATPRTRPRRLYLG